MYPGAAAITTLHLLYQISKGTGKKKRHLSNLSTPSPEKDSLLGPMVHKKIEYQNLKGDVFFAGPFISRFGLAMSKDLV